MEKIIVGAGATVHIHGIPFKLTQNAVMESHPANVAVVFGREAPFRLDFNPSFSKRFLRWLHRWTGR